MFINLLRAGEVIKTEGPFKSLDFHKDAVYGTENNGLRVVVAQKISGSRWSFSISGDLVPFDEFEVA